MKTLLILLVLQSCFASAEVTLEDKIDDMSEEIHQLKIDAEDRDRREQANEIYRLQAENERLKIEKCRQFRDWLPQYQRAIAHTAGSTDAKDIRDNREFKIGLAQIRNAIKVLQCQ